MAVEKQELPRLEDLYNRGIKNNVPDIQMIDGAKIKEIEPYCQVRFHEIVTLNLFNL